MSTNLTLDTIRKAKKLLEENDGKAPSLEGFEYAFHPVAHTHFLAMMNEFESNLLGERNYTHLYGAPVVVDPKLPYGAVILRPIIKKK